MAAFFAAPTAVPDAAPSEELRALLGRIYATWMERDFETLREMFSPGAHALAIGTAPDEWFIGGGHIVDMWAVQTRELGDARFEAGTITAHALGNVGWASDRPRIVLPDGNVVELRVTVVFAIERGHWRVVQWHASVAQGNEDTVGQVLTTSLERVERSVRDDRPDLRAGTAPDGTVTILFSDIESSTVLMERLGDIEWLRMLAWHDGIVKDTTGEHRGFVVKSQGDGFMLAFPSSAYALRACVTMRDRIAAGYNGLPIRIRMGLHAGETIRRDDDFYGRTVVIAARISALALGGEILASDLVYALARGLGTFRFGERRTATLKGLEGSFDVYPVLG